MGKQTFAWLLLLAALVAGAVVWQRGREADEDLGQTDLRLFEGVEVARVRGFYLDHLERSLQVRLERDARGVWYLTDPIAYPAHLGVVAQLLEIVDRGRALVVPEVERDARALGLDPPRALFTVHEEVDGAVREHRLEIGYVDLDGKRVNVRKDGRFLRILRTLDTTLKRSVDELRSPRVLQVAPMSVLALTRRGELQDDLAEAPRDLALDAVRDGDAWRSLLPREAALDPLDFSVLLIGAVALEADRFLDDAPRDLARYGLDRPDLTIELGLADGGREVLRFARAGAEGGWRACREGAPYVYGIADEDMLRLLLGYDELLDRLLMRVPRESIDALRLESPAGALRVARAAEGWTVARRAAGADAYGPAYAAEPARVARTLSELEQLELLGFRLDQEPRLEGAGLAVFVEAGGAELGGRIGGETTTDDGAPARRFQRLGDEVLALCDPWLAELAASRLSDFRSLDVALVTEVEVSGLVLSSGGRTLRYGRDARGRWTAAGAEAEALELVPLLDALLFLRADAHLEDGQPAAGAPLAGAVEVRFERAGRPPVVYTVARAPGPDGAPLAVVERDGARSVLRVSDLPERLAALFGR